MREWPALLTDELTSGSRPWSMMTYPGEPYPYQTTATDLVTASANLGHAYIEAH